MRRLLRWSCPVLAAQILFACTSEDPADVAAKPAPASETPSDQTDTRTEPRTRQAAFDAVARDRDSGKLPAGEAVMLQARLLFDPKSVPAHSAYRAAPDSPAPSDECMTGFYKDVHRAYSELTAEDRAALKALSPDLKVIVDQKE